MAVLHVERREDVQFNREIRELSLSLQDDSPGLPKSKAIGEIAENLNVPGKRVVRLCYYG